MTVQGGLGATVTDRDGDRVTGSESQTVALAARRRACQLRVNAVGVLAVSAAAACGPGPPPRRPPRRRRGPGSLCSD